MKSSRSGRGGLQGILAHCHVFTGPIGISGGIFTIERHKQMRPPKIYDDAVRTSGFLLTRMRGVRGRSFLGGISMELT